MKHFFYKLIPPRADFHLTQNETEKTIMASHVQYWTNLLATRKTITFGPVFHAEGVFGIAIIEAENEIEADDIAKNDPAVKEGICTFELSTMTAILPRS